MIEYPMAFNSSRIPILAFLMMGYLGCSTLPVTSKIIFQDGDNLVRLDVTYRRGSQEHTHPAQFSHLEMATVLRAIVSTPQRDLLSGRFHSNISEPPEAFWEEDIQFLAPLFAQGLKQATPLEEVVFYISRPRNNNIREISSGSLYVQETQLHFILANYRYTTSGRQEVEKIKTNPLTILGRPWYELNPGPYGRIINAQPWFHVFASSPQHLAVEYDPLFKSFARKMEKQNKYKNLNVSQPETLARKLQLLREMKAEGILTEQEFLKKREKVLNRR